MGYIAESEVVDALKSSTFNGLEDEIWDEGYTAESDSYLLCYCVLTVTLHY